MSWQSYVDDQLVATKMVKHAVICGHDGNIWAQSAGFTVRQMLVGGAVSLSYRPIVMSAMARCGSGEKLGRFSSVHLHMGHSGKNDL